MKKQALTLVGVLSLLLAAGSAFAQTGEIRASVPFNFIVNRMALPAGDYTISTAGGSDQVLVIRSNSGKALKLATANHVQANQPSKSTKLVFRCYGDRYFLSQVWTRGNARGRQLPKSALETEVAMDFTPHDVILVASLR